MIREAKHPVVCIKPLGAGRVLPPTGLGFVYDNIKPSDTVCIGMLSVEEAAEDIEIARACIERREAAIELQRTRSSDVLNGQPRLRLLFGDLAGSMTPARSPCA